MAQPSELVFPKLEERTSLLSVGALFVVIGSVVLIGLAILTAIIAATKHAQIKSLERKERELNEQLKSGELGEARTRLQGAVTSAAQLKSVLGSRTDWQALLKGISGSLLKSVRIISLNFDGKGTIRLDGQAQDYGSIAKQVTSLKKLKFVEKVEVSSLTTSNNTITFSLSVDTKLSQVPFQGQATP